MRRHCYRLALVGILALAVLLPMIPAGRRVLWGSNEARYPLLARDILDHGRWLVPQLRGHLYLNKPQLFVWAIAIASLPGGRVSRVPRSRPSSRRSRPSRPRSPSEPGSGAAPPGCSRA